MLSTNGNSAMLGLVALLFQGDVIRVSCSFQGYKLEHAFPFSSSIMHVVRGLDLDRRLPTATNSCSSFEAVPAAHFFCHEAIRSDKSAIMYMPKVNYLGNFISAARLS